MTEYETANLALQQAALTASYWQTGITLAVSSGLVLYGFRLMRRGTDARRAEMDAAAKAAEQRHVETMTVLQQQGRALDQQSRALDQQNRALDQQSRALDRQGRALEALIERTAPK